jgi:hypothetical protein
VRRRHAGCTLDLDGCPRSKGPSPQELIVSDASVINFIQAHIKSVWAIEQMLVLAREPDRKWQIDELVLETRSSSTAVREALQNLQSVGLIIQTQEGAYQFAPQSDELRDVAHGILQAYVERPRAVIQAIFAGPKDSLTLFADAFKFKRE